MTTMVVDTEALKEARDKGVVYLDEMHPGWREKIDKDRLVMSDPDRCILGQLHGCCYYCYRRDAGVSHTWGNEHGFDAPYSPESRQMEVLTELWKEIL